MSRIAVPRRATLVAGAVAVLGATACTQSGADPDPLTVGTAAQALRPPVDQTADLFLGQALPTYNTPNLVDRGGVSTVFGVAVDRSVSPPRLYVADTGNNRVLAWADAAGFTNGAPADLVLGQPDGYANSCNNGGVTASSLCSPRAVAVDAAGNLYVADTSNHRVLEYDSPFANDRVADKVFGQSNSMVGATCNLGGLTASSLCNPAGAAVDAAGSLFVADQSNHRVLRYDSPLTSDRVADAVLGQAALTTGAANLVDARGVFQATRVALDRSVTPNRLYVSDTANHRVLGWPDAAGFAAGAPATVVIGQPDFYANLPNNGGIGAATLNFPRGLSVDGSGNLYVADTSNHRVLYYATPFAGDAVADKVIGQASFTGQSCVASQTGLCNPYDVWVTSVGAVFVADNSNNRVLRYSPPIPTTGAPADAVIGQSSFTGSFCNSGGRSASSLCFPRGVTTDAGGNVYVADASNSRVLEYDVAPANAVADRVFGQADFLSGSCNRGLFSPASNTLCSPGSVAVDGAGNAWVGDASNSRVLGFITPLITDRIADVVVGQATFTASFCTPASSTCLGSAPGVGVDGSNNLFVADTFRNRVLRFDTPFGPPVNTTADGVLAQTDFTSTAANFVDERGLSSPAGLAIDRSVSPNRLWVVDGGNHRALGWSTVAFANADPAAKVLGQAGNLNGSLCNSGGVSANSLCTPQGVGADAAGNVYVADTSNSRVLEYTNPFAADLAADLVFGQTAMTGNFCNFGGVSALTLCSPRDASLDAAGNLFVADASNYRVLRYATPLTTDTAADQVLAQGGMTYNAANRVDAAGLSSPGGVVVDTSVTPNRVYIADTSNSRVLGWPDVTAFASGAPASLVIGQANLDAYGCNLGGVSASSLCFPYGMAVDGAGRLYLADTSNHRVLIYNAPFTTDAVADYVLGQSLFTGNLCNSGGVSAGSLCTPYGVRVDSAGNVYVADYSNSRVLEYDAPVATSNFIADRVLGQAGLTVSGCNVGGRSASTLCFPNDVAVDASNNVYVADSSNARVLEYDQPVATDTVADRVYGQTGFTAGFCATGAAGMCISRGVALDGNGTLYVSDSWNRVLRYDAPLTTDAIADQVYGQPNFTSTFCNGGGLGAATLCVPRGVRTDATGSLYVADQSNNRVPIYLSNSRPTATALAIAPAAPKTADNLVASYVYADADGDAESGTELRWFKDAVEQAAYFNLATVPSSATAKGQAWYFTVRPRDGIEFGALATAAVVTIANTAPTAASPAVSPASPKTDDVLTAIYVYADADADAEGASAIDWLKNNVVQPALANLKTVPASATTKGDLWQFKVRPSDGTDLGVEAASPVVTIGNTAPVATSPTITPASPQSTSSLTATWAYADADGDAQVGSEVRWYRNGVLQSAYNDQTSVPAPLTLDDSWYFTVRPRDGVDFGASVQSNTVIVGSSAPAASNLSITPSPARTDDVLTANYTYSDPDGQPESGSEIRWYKNAAVQSAYNDLKTVPAAATAKGESWYFTVRPKDGTLFGALQTAPTLVIANTAPAASAPAITPASPKTADPLVANYTYADADGDTESGSEIRWFKNGVEEATLFGLKTVPASATSRGDSWYFTVRPKDGTDLGAAQTSAAVAIVNTAPVASSPAVTPAAPKATDQLTATWAFTDADSDFQSGSEVRWFKNTIEQAGLFNQLTVPPSQLKKGDAWHFTVRPKDGIDFGAIVTSPAVTVANSPPVASNLAITPALPKAGEVLNANYSYADVDGDLESGSEIRWFKNGVEQAALFGLKTVPAGTTLKGEKWSFLARPKDGTDFGTPQTSPETSIANGAPLADTLAIAPSPARTSDNLTLTYRFADPDGDVESGTEIRWFKNGVEQAGLADLKVVPASATTKGESWYATVRPKDGTDFGGTATSTPVVIVNSPPTATNATVAPLSPKVTDALTGGYSYADADSDPQQGTEILWYRNDVEVPSLAGALTVPAGTAKAGETWYFTVKPRDGVDFGAVVQSTSVIVGSSAPVASNLLILPPSPRTDDQVTAAYTYTDPDNDPESGSEIRWYRDGTEEAAVRDLKNVAASYTARGESWTFTVRPKDGTQFGALQTSPPTVIANTPPSVSQALIQPAQPKTDDVLLATYTFADVDSDADTGSEIRWYKNGLEQSTLFGLGSVPASATKKNQVWVYRVRPYDGADFGVAEVSIPAFIANTAPAANAGPDQALQPTAVLTRVTLDGSATTDADADLLSYEWTEGATVLASGARPTVELGVGIHRITLSVSDGETSATDEVGVDIADPKPTAQVPAALSVPPGRVPLAGTATDPLSRPLTHVWSLEAGPTATIADPAALTTFAFARAKGTRTFRLVASTSTQSSDPADLAATTTDAPPWAAAGPRQVVAIGTAVALDGSNSADPNGDPLTFEWKVVAGPAGAALSGETTAAATFTPAAEGLHELSLVVSDGANASAPARWEVFAIDPAAANRPPVAVAGDDVVTEVGRKVTLDGRASYDLDGDPIAFAWKSVEQPAGAAFTLAGAALPVASFTPPAPGRYVVALSVKDGTQASPEDRVVVDVLDPNVNRRPVARVVTPLFAKVSDLVTLDGTKSIDPDGDALTYAWQQLSGVTAALSDPKAASPTFTALEPGALVFALTAHDGTIASAPAGVTVIVTDGANRAPLANAGADQRTLVGTEVRLDGTGSSDPDGDPITYLWEQLGGAWVMLADARTAATRFQPKGTGRYRFRLVVRDPQAPSVPDEVEVIVSTHGVGADNQPPVAVVGPDQEVAVNHEVTLDASASADPDPLDRLTYQWTVTAFPSTFEPSLSDLNAAQPTFTPFGAGTYSFALRVSDGDLTSEPATAHVVVLDATSSRSGCGCGGAGAMPVLAALLGLALGHRRRVRTSSAPAGPRRGRGVTATALAALFTAASAAHAAPPPPKKPKPTVAAAQPAANAAPVKKVKAPSLPGPKDRGPSRGPVAKKEAPAKSGFPAGVAPLPMRPAAPPGPAPTPPAAPETTPPAPDIPVAEPPPARLDVAMPPAPAGMTVKRKGTAAGPANPFFEEARDLYANFQFDGILPKLEFALAVKGVTPEQKVEIFKLMAFTRAAFDEQAVAEEAFVKLLEVNPLYELKGGASPKIRQYFASAQKTYRLRQAVKLVHVPPTAATRGESTTVDVVAAAGADRVAKMTLHYRPEGSTGGFSQVPMKAGDGGAFSAAVPNVFAGPAGRRTVEYFVRARGSGGELLLGVGSEEQPLRVEIESMEAAGPPLYTRWWVWGGAAAIAAAAVVTPLALRRDAVLPAASLGRERLP